MDDLEQLRDPHNGAACWLVSGLASRQSVTPQWRPQDQCPVWTRQVCKTRAPAREPRKKQDSKSFALACAFLRSLVWPSVSCVSCFPFSGAEVFHVRAPTQEPRWRNKFQKLCSHGVLSVSCPFCVVGFSAVPGLCSFLLVSFRGPKKPSTLEFNPQVRMQ